MIQNELRSTCFEVEVRKQILKYFVHHHRHLSAELAPNHTRGRRGFRPRVATATTTRLGSCAVSHGFYSESGTLRINARVLFPVRVGTGKDLSKPTFQNRCRLSSGGGVRWGGVCGRDSLRAHRVEIRSLTAKLLKAGCLSAREPRLSRPSPTCFSRAKK